MGLWATIIQQTSSSPWRLLAFGGVCVAGSVALGSVFTGVMAPTPPSSPADSRRVVDNMSYDDKRFATAREQRLSHMIKDMVEGQGDQHWHAAMRGTLVRHPNQENKTQRADSEALARAKAAAAQR